MLKSSKKLFFLRTILLRTTYFPLALSTPLLGSRDREIFMSEGSMFQMSRAYSLIVRSLENFPAAAMFLSTMMFQAFGFCKQELYLFNWIKLNWCASKAQGLSAQQAVWQTSGQAHPSTIYGESDRSKL